MKTSEIPTITLNDITNCAAPAMFRIEIQALAQAELDRRENGTASAEQILEPVDDEPDQQRCNHCMTISDAELPTCPKCGRDDALMFPFEEVKPEPVEPWQKLLEYDSYTRIGLAIQQLQRRHDAMQKQIEEHVIRPNKSMSVGGTASGPT